MTDYGITDTSTTTLSTNQFPVSAVWVANDRLRPVQGGPTTTDGGGKVSAPVSMYVADGSDVTLGTSTDANTVASVMGRLTKIRDLLAATIAVTQSGTWNITNVSGTVSLPTGASTAAKQPALGTAGTASADVITIQGIASMTAVKVDGSAVTQPVSGTFWQATQPVSGTVTANAGSGTFTVSGTVTANAGTNLNTSALALETGGNLATLAGIVSSSKAAVKSADGDQATIGAKADAKNSATDTTAVSVVSLLKQISYQAQNPASTPVTGTVTANAGSGTFTVSGTVTANAGTGTFTNQQSNITTDYDTGAGTQTMTMFGLALPASGGSVAGGTSSNPMQVSLANTGANSSKLLVTPDSVALPAHQSTNVDQLNGTTTDTNSGSKSAGTLRVVLATDQPQLSNKLLVTPDSVALPANQSVNVSQINGVTTTMGNGVSGTGVQRVTIASDSTGQVALAAGTNTVGSVKLSDGTNSANVLAATSASNASSSQAAQLIAGAFAEQTSLSAGSLNADLVASTDVSNYKMWSLQVLTVAGGGTLTFQGSNDNSTFVSVEAYNVANNNAAATTTSSAGVYYGVCAFHYLRVRQTAYTSGSSTGVLELYTNPFPLLNRVVNASQNGTWHMNLRDDNGSSVSLGQTTMSSSLPVAIASNQSAVAANITQFGSSTIATGTGAGGSGIPRVTVSNDSNVLATQSGTWTAVQNTATSGGATPYHLISANTTNATNVKGSAGQLYGLVISNAASSARYFKLYDKATAPTVGTDTPKATIQVPANGTVIRAYPPGLVFASGIGFSTNTGIADADTGAVGTSDLSIDLDYK